jgi:hypothetical protein
LDVLDKAGYAPTRTLGLPGTQGATVFGIHGIGVSTPRAAAVAEATVGFASEVHIPKGGIFTIGFLSMIVAAGEDVRTFMLDVTISVEGVVPNGQNRPAPAHTHIAIITLLLIRTDNPYR